MVKIMKILTIGNSFSENSTRFLPAIFADAGKEITIGKCVLGGCTLERHWNNAVNNEPTYGSANYGGDKTLREMLTAEKWDVVTMQQASPMSWRIRSYYPYIDNLAALVRELAPQAEIIIQQTWAYRTDNIALNTNFMISQDQMFDMIRENYNEICDRLGSRLFPVGEAFRIMQEETNDPVGMVTRLADGPSHANPLGEYIGALIWYAVLTGGDPDAIRYVPEIVNPTFVPAAKKAVRLALELYN